MTHLPTNPEKGSAMTTPNNRPDDFEPLADDREVQAALEPRKTLRLPAATAVLLGVVVLAAGVAGGAGLHAALGSDAGTAGAQPPAGRGAYGGVRGQGQGMPGGGQGGQNAAIGTVVSANASQLVIRTQDGDVTVKLTGETAIEITDKGTTADLKPGEQVVVSGATTDGAITAQTVRQGGTMSSPGGNRPGATPSR